MSSPATAPYPPPPGVWMMTRSPGLRLVVHQYLKRLRVIEEYCTHANAQLGGGFTFRNPPSAFLRIQYMAPRSPG